MIRRPPRSTLSPSTPLFRSPPVLADHDRPPLTRLDALRHEQHAPSEDIGVDVEHDLVPSPLRRVVDPAKWTGYEVVLNVYPDVDRKSTRLNSSHGYISYAVF